MTQDEIEVRAYVAKMRRRNVLIAPLTIFVRMPIMLIGLGLAWLGNWLCGIADKMPGWVKV